MSVLARRPRRRRPLVGVVVAVVATPEQVREPATLGCQCGARQGSHAVNATMSLALRLLDGVEETLHTTSTPSTRHLEEGSAPQTLPSRHGFFLDF